MHEHVCPACPGASSSPPARAGCVSWSRPGAANQMGRPTLASSVFPHGSVQRPHKRLGRRTECQTSGDAGWNLRPCPRPGRPRARTRGRAATRTHRVPLSPMVRGGRREVRGVSAQAGKSPAARRSAGQPAPGYPAPPPPLSPPPPPPGSPPVAPAAQRPGRRQGRGACGCERACVAPCAALRVRAESEGWAAGRGWSTRARARERVPVWVRVHGCAREPVGKECVCVRERARVCVCAEVARLCAVVRVCAQSWVRARSPAHAGAGLCVLG